MMKKEMFVIEIQEDGRSTMQGSMQHALFTLIDQINNILKEKHYSSRELYQLLIYEGYLKPTYFKEFQGVIRLGIREGMIDPQRLISKTTTVKKLPNVFYKEQIVQFFENCDDVRMAVSCFIALWCALRIGEVSRLHIRDIDYDSETLKIVQSKRSKDRMAPFLKEGHNVIKKWLEYCGTNDYIFPSTKQNSERKWKS